MFIQQEILLSSVFIAGFLSFFSPCTFPLMPVYIGILSDDVDKYGKFKIFNCNLNIGAILKTIFFVFGISLSFIVLGFGFSSLLKYNINKNFIFFAGILVFLLGIHQMEIIKFDFLDKIFGIRIKNNNSKLFGAFIMGVSFSIGWTPCIGPILTSVLITSSLSGQALYGAFLMFLYSLGLLIPFLILSLFSDILLNKITIFNKYLVGIKKFGGFMISIMGIILMSNNINSVTMFFENVLSAINS